MRDSISRALSRFCFFDLPAEVRNDIYNYLIPPNSEFAVAIHKNPDKIQPYMYIQFHQPYPATQILRISKRMKNETSQLMQRNVRGIFIIIVDPTVAFTMISKTLIACIDEFNVRTRLDPDCSAIHVLKFPNLRTYVIHYELYNTYLKYIDPDDKDADMAEGLKDLEKALNETAWAPDGLEEYVPESWQQLKQRNELEIQVFKRWIIPAYASGKEPGGVGWSRVAQRDFNWNRETYGPMVATIHKFRIKEENHDETKSSSPSKGVQPVRVLKPYFENGSHHQDADVNSTLGEKPDK